MMHPTFDHDGYPTEETLQAIRGWEADMHALFAFIGEAWRYPDYWHREGDTYRFSTGGWSGNESLIEALEANFVAWAICWLSSARGGHYVFSVPMTRKAKEG